MRGSELQLNSCVTVFPFKYLATYKRPLMIERIHLEQYLLVRGHGQELQHALQYQKVFFKTSIKK